MNSSAATWRRGVRARRGTDPSLDPVADNLNALIRRVSGASMEEIDRVIAELQTVRDMLRREGERVSREIAGYASLSHAAMTAMKVIGESVTQWKSAPGATITVRRAERRPANSAIAVAGGGTISQRAGRSSATTRRRGVSLRRMDCSP